jgi:ribosome-associated translation inhibitor RaiA
MQLTTTFRDMLPSPALQAAIERWSERLEQVSQRIVGCHVAVEQPHRHHSRGAPFLIHIDLAVPGGHLAVSNKPDQDAYAALNGAFRAARRQLVHHVGLQRQFVKRPAVGRRAGAS